MDDNNSTSRRGKRLNAGHKESADKFGEPTAVMRVPVSQKQVVVDFLAYYQQRNKKQGVDTLDLFEYPVLNASKTPLPLFSSKVRAGFPSPADDHVETRLDVGDYLVQQADATFFATIIGDSMKDAGLLSGDKAVVNRAKQASIGDIVLAVIDGEFTIKTLGKSKQGLPRLIPANVEFPIIEINEHMQFEIWGVVTGSFRRF